MISSELSPPAQRVRQHTPPWKTSGDASAAAWWAAAAEDSEIPYLLVTTAALLVVLPESVIGAMLAT